LIERQEFRAAGLDLPGEPVADFRAVRRAVRGQQITAGGTLERMGEEQRVLLAVAKVGVALEGGAGRVIGQVQILGDPLLGAGQPFRLVAENQRAQAEIAVGHGIPVGHVAGIPFLAEKPHGIRLAGLAGGGGGEDVISQLADLRSQQGILLGSEQGARQIVAHREKLRGIAHGEVGVEFVMVEHLQLVGDLAQDADGLVHLAAVAGNPAMAGELGHLRGQRAGGRVAVANEGLVRCREPAVRALGKGFSHPPADGRGRFGPQCGNFVR